MRKRLLLALVCLGLLTVILYAVPRGFILAEQARDEERDDLHQLARLLQVVVEAEVAEGRPLSLVPIEPVLGPDDAVRVTRPGLPAPLVAGDASAAAGGLSVTREVDGGTLLEVMRSSRAVDEHVAESVLPIVGVGAAVLTVAVAAAFVLAGRLTRPFSELARAAGRLGDATFDLDLPKTRVEEAASIAEALRASAGRLDEMLRREREFASNASHQLRTPLTALRLSLEDLMLWPDAPEAMQHELREGLAQVDRLEETISGLLALSRNGAYGRRERVEAGALVRTAVERWEQLAADAGRRVRVGPVQDAAVAVPPDAVRQVLDVLLDNALKHGAGDVTVEVARDGSYVRFAVSDDGPGLADDDRERVFERGASRGAGAGTGIGLALARELTTTIGGRLSIRSGAPTTFELGLPAA